MRFSQNRMHMADAKGGDECALPHAADVVKLSDR